MGPARSRVNVFQGLVQHFDVGRDQGQELGVIQVFIAGMAAHGQVGAVDLHRNMVTLRQGLLKFRT